MEDCTYPIYSNLWFWMIALGILFLAIGLIVWDVRVNLSESWWVWFLIIGGAILLIIGLVLAIWQWWRQDGLDVDLFDEEPAPACAMPSQVAVAQKTTTQQTTIAPASRTTRRRVVQQATMGSNDIMDVENLPEE